MIGPYMGSYQSALARSRRILKAAGFPIRKVTGRYHPFVQGTQKITHGVNVFRIGCSDTIAIITYGAEWEGAEAQAKIVEALRGGGMPFDDKGNLYCGTQRDLWRAEIRARKEAGR